MKTNVSFIFLQVNAIPHVTGWNCCCPRLRVAMGGLSIVAPGGGTSIVTAGVLTSVLGRLVNGPIRGRRQRSWIPEPVGMTMAGRQSSPRSPLWATLPIHADRLCWSLCGVAATWPLCRLCVLYRRRLLAAPGLLIRRPWFHQAWILWHRGDAAPPVEAGEGTTKSWRTRPAMIRLSLAPIDTWRQSAGPQPKNWTEMGKRRHCVRYDSPFLNGFTFSFADFIVMFICLLQVV